MEVVNKVPEEQAVMEVKAFAEYHKEKGIADEKITEDYPDIIEAVKLGLLVFDDEQTPTLTLKKPVKTTEGNVALDRIVFKTRIRASEKEKLTKGIDLEGEQVLLLNKLKAFFMQQPKAYLDKLESKFDERVIDQICTVFM